MLDVKRNLTTMTDFYELTMSAGYLDEGYKDKIAVFDMFFRKVPDGGGYAIMAGLEQFINAVDSLEFTEEDINYLRSTGAFNEQFLDYLRNFKLHCNIWAIEEGMPIFPQEPIVTVEGPAIECQLLETLLLVTFNHQCLIATKANRICRAAGTMKSAYLIDTNEAVQCISDVLIGLQMGFLSGMDAQKLYALEEHIRPAMLTGAPQDRDKKRAEILREATKPIQFN
jgi:putative nicotinate phosphoribosyltransferase